MDCQAKNSVQPDVEFSTVNLLNMAREAEPAPLVVDGEMVACRVEKVMARDAAHEALGKSDPERRSDLGRQV